MSAARYFRTEVGFRMQASLTACLLCATFVATAQPANAQEVAADPPGRVARLSHTEGEVSLAPAGSEAWGEVVLNRPLTSGDRLWVERDARAELQVGSAAIYLDQDTSFGFLELHDAVMQMSLTDGAATIRIRRRGAGETIQVETPNVAVSLLHPGEYHVEVDPDGDLTIVRARSGEAEVFGGELTHVVRAGEEGVFSGLTNLAANIGRLGPRTVFEDWANDRDRREQRSASSRYVSRDVIGYEDLDEHGDWIHEPEYGHVWRPRHVTHDWAPYRDGRWLWVSPWGWTWVDNARWGFAPYHYGRWAYTRSRWCWVPGPRHLRPVYAPALVGWVGRPGIDASVSFGSGVGWFPLGPRELYVPGYRHSPRYSRHINISNTVVVNHTHITNIYSGRGHRFDYRHRHHPHAITAVERDHFVGGRPIGGDRLRINDTDLRAWRDDARPPAIAPDRRSIRDPVLNDGVTRDDGVASRDPPKKDRSDFRVVRPGRGAARADEPGRLNPGQLNEDRRDRLPQAAPAGRSFTQPARPQVREDRASNFTRGSTFRQRSAERERSVQPRREVRQPPQPQQAPPQSQRDRIESMPAQQPRRQQQSPRGNEGARGAGRNRPRFQQP